MFLLQARANNHFLSVTKPLCLFEILVDSLGIYFNPKAEPYTKLFFENANSGYAEVSTKSLKLQATFSNIITRYDNTFVMASTFYLAINGSPGDLRPKVFWRLATPSKIHCKFGEIVCFPRISPFRAHWHARTAPYMKFVSEILEKLPQWREERLPPPRVNQSEVTHLLFSFVPNGI
jgi:proteasome activator subunit 4